MTIVPFISPKSAIYTERVTMMVSEPIRPYYLFAALLILILAPSVLLAEDLKPPDSKNFAKEGTGQFLAILHEEKLSPDGERALVKVLADRLENEDYQIINEGFRHRLRNRPGARRRVSTDRDRHPPCHAGTRSSIRRALSIFR